LNRNRRRRFLAAAGLWVVAGSGRAAQQPKVFRIGFLGVANLRSYAPQVEALRAGLRDLGYVEGRNIAIEYRWADGDYQRLPALAAELVRSNPDVIITHSQPGTRALKAATKTIPIVMALAGEAVESGLVANLVRPGGNITGSTFFLPELAAERLEILRDTLPHLRHVGLLSRPNPGINVTVEAVERAAKALKLHLQRFSVASVKEIENAFVTMSRSGIEALAVIDSPVTIDNSQRIAQLALQARLPLIGFNELAIAGGLIGYGVDYPAMYRRAAFFVDKILKGANPGDIPIERATRFELVINLKTAKALGVSVPPVVMVRANRVIE
jgi:putative ABC transport system substrate-binding protein